MTFIPLDNIAKKKRFTKGKEGIVVYNEDPLRLGRIKVGIKGQFEASNYNDLPWVNRKAPSFLGASKNSEMFAVPELQSKVWVTFPFGDTNFPYYEDFPYSNEACTKEFYEDYPESYGFKDSVGFLFRINKAKKHFVFRNDKFSVSADSKSTFTIDAATINLNGSVNASCGADGSFATGDGKIVIVSKGIITAIV